MKTRRYSRARIIDEFTDLPVSRGRKYQLRRDKEGKCIKCGQPQVTAFYCLKHMLAAREATRKKHHARRRNRSLSYRLEVMAEKSRRRRRARPTKPSAG